MKNTINVNGIRVYAYHGCLPEEAKIGGHYLVHIRIQTDFSRAMENDQLSNTLDYVTVNRIVQQEMAIRSKLIEHVGQRIFKHLHQELKGIDSLRVEIVKLTPPINGDVESVSIVIED